jgi:prepilin-type N-terminal cleavage/methylation domain-containing protein/prepilin-type processing-associated H-X9-DG protein
MELDRNTNTSSNAGNNGFTLIELLVVVSIISLLMAILLPTLGRVRQLTRRIVCKSNLKQIALAWDLYLDYHEGKFFQLVNANRIYGGWKGERYPNKVRPLNKHLGLSELPQSKNEARVFKCPGDIGADGPYCSIGTSYQTNILVVGENQTGPFGSVELTNAINKKLLNLNRSQVDNPAQVLLVGDYHWASQWMPSPYPRGQNWHGRCCHYNLAFLDGHVEFLRIRKGLFVTDEYSVIPFRNLYGLASKAQEEEPCPLCE